MYRFGNFDRRNPTLFGNHGNPRVMAEANPGRGGTSIRQASWERCNPRHDQSSYSMWGIVWPRSAK
jgi:hypothetical protein